MGRSQAEVTSDYDERVIGHTCFATVRIQTEARRSGDSLSDVYISVLYIRHKALHYTADALREGDRYPSFKKVPLLS